MGKRKVGVASIAQLAVASFALGAGVAFFFDSRAGGRRRALVRDKLIHFRNVLRITVQRDAHDLGNRARGLVAETKTRLASEDVTDDVLIERVRAKLGHVSLHAHAIEVYPKGKGIVELKGPISAIEYPRVLAAVRLVPGVRGLDDDLIVHDPKDVIARHSV